VIRLEAVSAAVPGTSGEPRQILRDVDLEIQPGESHLILGANGSGKTTLIRILAGFHRPASGRVLLDGTPIAGDRNAPSLWPRVAVLFEEPDPQFLTDSVEAEIAFGLESLALPPEEIRARTAEALESFELAGFESRAPHTLSAGEKARTLLAAVMAAKPRVLLLDQSLAHLDPGARRELERRLVETACSSGGFALVRTHQDADAPYPGERVHLIADARLADATSLRPDAVLAARDVPFPLAMRASALLSANGSWSGALALDPVALAAGLGPAGSGGGGAGGGDRSSPSGNLGERTSAPPGVESGSASLSFRHVSYSQRWAGGRTPLIADVTLEVGEGECVALIGVSGSGKSTLLKLAAGLLEPTSGLVHRASSGNGRGRPTALALEYPERQLFGRTVEEDVTATLWVDGVPEAERHTRGRDAMGMVGLDPDRFGARIPLTLSEGEKRRVALASLLAEPPRALLLDEPTAGLDPEGRRSLATVIRGLTARGHAILMASHDLDFVSTVARRVAVLGRDRGGPGGILGVGTPASVWRQSALLESAGIPVPEHLLVQGALHRAGLIGAEPVRDADTLLVTLAKDMVRRNVVPSEWDRVR
jgi:energy-coupling factor transport system ATP-binding protein